MRAGPGGPRLALFPADPTKGVSGALAQGSDYSPTTFGTKVYLEHIQLCYIARRGRQRRTLSGLNH